MTDDITEGRLAFSFSDGCDATKYDQWAFVRNQFQSICGGTKAVDILCMDGGFYGL